MKLTFLRFLMPVFASCLFAADPEHAVHDPAVKSGAGLKKELFAGIQESDYVKVGANPKTAHITLIASMNDENHGMNFNGYSHGAANFVIPLGWRVEVTFINPSPVPHSAIVVERETLRKVQMGEPAFVDASTANPVLGTSTGTAAFTFLASSAGEYALACGIPTHASAGHWVRLTISPDATEPTLQKTGAPVNTSK